MSYLMYATLFLGVFETVSNAFHLSKGSIGAVGQSARRQHQELPLDRDESHFFAKAIIMLGFGLLFLVTGILFLSNADLGHRFAFFSFILFAFYGLGQAIVYRKTVKVWPAALVHAVPLVLWLIVR